VDKPVLPPSKEGVSVTALALAVFVHALLAGLLFLGVQWKSQAPSVVSVEVWQGAPAPVASRPKPAPKPAPPPPPEPKPDPVPEPPPPPPPAPEPVMEPAPPPDPDIAIKEGLEKERLEKERLEKERLEKERQEKERQEKERLAKAQREKERREELLKQADREAQRQRTMQDMIAGADAEIRQRQAQQTQAARERAQNAYIARIRGKIKGNTVLPHTIEGNPEAIFKVTQLPSGEIIDVRITQSSGNKALDEAIERAIRKSGPLPLPDPSSLFERVLELKYKPFDEPAP
jgi:colicin import membrane protein